MFRMPRKEFPDDMAELIRFNRLTTALASPDWALPPVVLFLTAALPDEELTLISLLIALLALELTSTLVLPLELDGRALGSIYRSP